MDEIRSVAERALELWRSGDVTSAEPLFWQCWKARHPIWSPLAGWKLGDILRERGQLREAIEILREATDTWDHPEYGAHARISLGVALAASGDPDAADRQFRWVSDLDRSDVSPVARFNLGLAAQNHGLLAEAIEHYQAAVDSGHPEMAPRAGTNLGVVYRALGRPAQARRAFNQVIDSGHPLQAELARQNLDLLGRRWLVLNLMLEAAALIATVALWALGDRSLAWSTRLGSFVCVSSIMANLIGIGPLRPDRPHVGLGLRLTTAGISLLGVFCVGSGFVTKDSDSITVGATLITGSELVAHYQRRD